MARDLLTICCPEDIREAIEQKMAATGRGRTEVVVELLRNALNLPTTAQPLTNLDALYERVISSLME